MTPITREVANLRRSLKSVDGSLRRLVPLLSSVVSNGAGKTGRVSRRLSRKARASLPLQGRYMGYMRQLKPRQKAHVRRIKQAKGVRAAIARARVLARP